MKTRTETFRCFLKIHSPVHIGCDEVYEPTSFVVDETGTNGPEMIVFDPMVFIGDLDDQERQRFSDICKKGTVSSIIELYKFLRGKKAIGKRVDLCNGFIDHYKKVLALPTNERSITQNLNKFEVKRTSFRPYDERPYIPGSAIKGALRTAYLNVCDKTKNQKLEIINGKINKLIGENHDRTIDKDLAKYEKTLQSEGLKYESKNIETDPFRLIKVSDFQPVGEIKTKIVYAVNKKKKLSDTEARGPYQILETIALDSVFTGEITVEQPVSDRYIRQPVKLTELLEACSVFYSSENARELSELSKVKIKGVKAENRDQTIPLRIGRHSGAESLTVEEYRCIKIMKGGKEKPVYLPHATTFWLTSETDKASHSVGLKPFGWASLSPLTSDLQKQFSTDEDVFCNEFDRCVLERLDAAENAKQEALRKIEEEKRLKEEARLKQLELEQKAREEEDKKALLDSMPPAEKYAVQLADPSFPEHEAVKIFDELKNFDGEEKATIASALKGYWTSNKKWSKKDCSRKQLEKVKAIKTILGEP